MKTRILAIFPVLLLAGACSKQSGGGVKLKNDLDSVAYNDKDLIVRGKIGILLGSVAAAVVGSVLILLLSHKRQKS